MKSIAIEVVENGFVVSESPGRGLVSGKMWVFENPSSLAGFIESWAMRQEEKAKNGGVDNTPTGEV